jgi:hypothetical protein
LRLLILLPFISQQTPLHLSARERQLETCRLLVESKADIAASDRCSSTSRALRLPLTPCAAAVDALRSKLPATTWLHIFAASTLRNEFHARNNSHAIVLQKLTLFAGPHQ